MRAVAYSGDAATLVVAGQLPFVYVFNASTGKAKLHPETRQPLELEYSQWVYTAQFSPTGLLACGGYENNVKIFDVGTGEKVHILRCVDVVRDLCFSYPSGKMIAVGGKDNKVTLFETETAKVLRTIDKEHEVRTIEMSPRGELLASGDTSSLLELHMLRTFEEFHSIGKKDESPFLRKVHERRLAPASPWLIHSWPSPPHPPLFLFTGA